MKAWVLDFAARRVEPRDVCEPAPGEVLFRVREVGVCGTDRALAAFRLGAPPEGAEYLVLGHEAVGQVEETGAGVTALRRGAWVVPTVRRACRPPCASCARGRRDLCVSGRYRERGIFRAHGYSTEWAVDDDADLVRVPEPLVDSAILIEPLSVVEKAIARALAIHPGEPRNALVLGAGGVGVLAALLFQLRGLAVAVHSLEPEDHPRAALLRRCGVTYGPMADADIILEAAGSAELALAAVARLAPLGVMCVLGATEVTGQVPFLRMILNNQTVFGSVNASPDSFRAAREDLERLDPGVRRALIERVRFEEFASTLTGPPRAATKVVHVISE